jgi:membrane-bound lytic murein transglycosylase A
MSEIRPQIKKPILAFFGLLLLSACAGSPPTVEPPIHITPIINEPSVSPLPDDKPQPLDFEGSLAKLDGFSLNKVGQMSDAISATCNYKGGTLYAKTCSQWLAFLSVSSRSLEEKRDFILTYFEAKPLEGEGLMTGYYVPEYESRLIKSDEFSQVIRLRPNDLVVVSGSELTPPISATRVAARKVGDQFVPYYERSEIETMSDHGGIYMRPEDYFFMQLQGSGFVTNENGLRVYAAYAADNGRPFTGIAKTMVEKGYLKENETSGDNIHKWLRDNRGAKATEVMNTNKRYAFFVIRPDQKEAIGAANIGLPPKAAIAIDPNHHGLGQLFWIDAKVGNLAGGFPHYQGLVAALDTGGAIKGRIRADYYLGIGKEAGTEAGRIKHKLKFWIIQPRTMP